MRQKLGALLALSLALGCAGVLAGLAPSAAEPNGEFVNCGPALFHRTMPHPACAQAYAPFDTLAVVLLAAAVLALAFTAAVVVRSEHRRRRLGGPIAVHSTAPRNTSVRHTPLP